MGKKSGRKSNWRQIISQRNQVHEVELPSGMVVVARKPDMLDFVLGGEVPQTFFSEMMKLTDGTKEIDLIGVSPDAFKGIVELGERMMMVCCVDPIVWIGPTTIVPEGDGSGDRLDIKEIGANDKVAFFTWSTGDADALKTFRTEAGAVGEPTSDGEGIQPATE